MCSVTTAIIYTQNYAVITPIILRRFANGRAVNKKIKISTFFSPANLDLLNMTKVIHSNGQV